MKHLMALLVVLGLLVPSQVLAQGTATSKCPGEGNYVLQHKSLAVKLTLHIAPIPIERNGTKTCPTLTEILNKLKESYPEYDVKEIAL